MSKEECEDRDVAMGAPGSARGAEGMAEGGRMTGVLMC